jgi:hypothetical protein
LLEESIVFEGAGMQFKSPRIAVQRLLVVLLAALAACQSGPTEPLTEDPPTDTVPDNPPPDPVVIEDDFERPALGSEWTIYNGDAGIVSASDLGAFSNSGGVLAGLSIVGYTGETFQPDQFSEAVLSPELHPDLFVQVWVRRRESDNQRYGFHWQDSPDLWVLKLDGAPQGQELVTVPGSRPEAGDTIRVEISGTTLSGFLNGEKIIETSDATLSGGVPGVSINVNRGSIPPGDFPVSAAERWSGGDLGN